MVAVCINRATFADSIKKGILWLKNHRWMTTPTLTHVYVNNKIFAEWDKSVETRKNLPNE